MGGDVIVAADGKPVFDDRRASRRDRCAQARREDSSSRSIAVTRSGRSPSRSGGNRHPPPSSRSWPATLQAGNRRDEGSSPRRLGPRRVGHPRDPARAAPLSLSCRGGRRREARARLPAARRGSSPRRRAALGRRRLRATIAGWYCVRTDPFPCPAAGCTFVADYMTAAHLVLVWEERDDPNLLWHAQRAKEVGRNPRVVVVRVVVRSERVLLRVGGGRPTGARGPRQGLTPSLAPRWCR